MAQEFAEVVVREILPANFEFAGILPMEAVRQAQRKEPVEVVGQLQQLAEATLNQGCVISPDDEITADGQASGHAELAVSPDMEGGALQQVADEDGIGGVIGDQVARQP